MNLDKARDRKNKAWDEFVEEVVEDPLGRADEWDDVQVFRCTRSDNYILHLFVAGNNYTVYYDSRTPGVADFFYFRKEGDLQEPWHENVEPSLQRAFDEISESYYAAPSWHGSCPKCGGDKGPRPHAWN